MSTDQTSRLLSDDELAAIRARRDKALPDSLDHHAMWRTVPRLLDHIGALTDARDDAQEALYFADAGEQMERARADRLAVENAELRAMFTVTVYADDGTYHVGVDHEKWASVCGILATEPDARVASILAAGQAMAALIDGIGRVAERRMGICPLCDEHWNQHGTACPLRALVGRTGEG